MCLFTIDRKKQMTITKGDTAFFDVTISNYEFVEGDILYFTVKEDVNSDKNVIQKKVTEFDKNVAKIVLSISDTNIDLGSYVYDIQLSLSDGRVDTVMLPTKFEVIAGVTHD